MRPIAIPPTSPRRYLSFHRALNLRLPDEDTGDWHALPAWFCGDDSLRPVACRAGAGEPVDTTPALGTRGVREMGARLRACGMPAEGPVWAANHPRAIADLVVLDLLEGHAPMIAGVREINGWLDTEEQVNELREGYLAPLGRQLTGRARDLLEAWLPGVRWG